MNIAYIIFNRLDHTKCSFDKIRQAQPNRLLLIADGHRETVEGEASRCREVRDYVTSSVDWDCEVLTNFSEKNLGCKNRVSSGIDWVFSQVEEAIILEDDCVPHMDFFRFCEEMLERYRYDERVMHIGGQNMIPEVIASEDSYYASKFPHIWGWATWRRAWSRFDVGLSDWNQWKEAGGLTKLFANKKEADYWAKIFDKVTAGEIDVWGYQWMYACFKNGGLCLIPHVNLISNIGYGEDATHTGDKKSEWANMEAKALGFPLRHPDKLEVNEEVFSQLLDKAFLPKRTWRTPIKEVLQYFGLFKNR